MWYAFYVILIHFRKHVLQYLPARLDDYYPNLEIKQLLIYFKECIQCTQDLSFVAHIYFILCDIYLAKTFVAL